ncbi:MAG: phosphonate C-P lyase system protein PhnL [Thermodesulfobacteriota bacterium]
MLEIEQLSKTFHIHILGEKVIQALEDVSFKVSPGEFLGVSGPSGIGKSTLLKCIYRTYLSSGGRIWFNSRTWGRLDLARAAHQLILEVRKTEIGYVSQFLQVLPRVSALDTVAEPLLLKNGLSRTEARKIAGGMLERLQIPPNLFEAYPVTFSGGEQQRLNLARAVIWKPRLLLLDEPTSALDQQTIAIVVEILRELKSQGTTLIGIFHHDNLMTSIMDRVHRLSQEN